MKKKTRTTEKQLLENIEKALNVCSHMMESSGFSFKALESFYVLPQYMPRAVQDLGIASNNGSEWKWNGLKIDRALAIEVLELCRDLKNPRRKEPSIPVHKEESPQGSFFGDENKIHSFKDAKDLSELKERLSNLEQKVDQALALLLQIHERACFPLQEVDSK